MASNLLATASSQEGDEDLDVADREMPERAGEANPDLLDMGRSVLLSGLVCVA